MFWKVRAMPREATCHAGVRVKSLPSKISFPDVDE